MAPPPDEPIGLRIRRLRRERGLSLRQLAAPGVSYTYLSRVETGARMPSVHAIRTLARKLAVSPEYLETGVELTKRDELELALADLELAVRLEPTENLDVEQCFRDLVRGAEREGEDYLLAKARAALGILLAGSARLTEAIELIETALEHPLASPVGFTEAYVNLAVAYISAGRNCEAAKFCEAALSATPREAGAVRLMLATHLSTALAELGEYDEAQRVLDEHAPAARDADPYTRVRMHWSLARLATGRNERELALRHMRKAITLLEGTEDKIRLGRAHIVSAQILLWSGRMSGTAEHLQAARKLLPRDAGPEEIGALTSLEALLAARLGHATEAAELAGAALTVLRDNERGQAAAAYAAALAAVQEQRYAEADASFSQTIRLLEEARMWREASMVARDRSRACRAAGDSAAAKSWSQQASEYANRVPARSR